MGLFILFEDLEVYKVPRHGLEFQGKMKLSSSIEQYSFRIVVGTEFLEKTELLSVIAFCEQIA